MSHKFAQFVVPFLAGLGLGCFHFIGLWWTVRRLPCARRPVLLNLASLIFRMAVILGGFYIVMAGQWERLLVCLLGFIAARGLLVRRLGP